MGILDPRPVLVGLASVLVWAVAPPAPADAVPGGTTSQG